MAGCMEGIRIVELGHWVVVPSATAILADWGAEVIKIEDPGVGDPMRGVRSIEGLPLAPEGVQPGFEVLNRNKKGVTINLRVDKGREILYRLVEKADIFISNFQPQVLRRFEIDYKVLSKKNPRLIYGVVTGYGDTGPDRDKPGYDYSAFWARSGIMDKISDPEGPPRPQRPGMGDNITSLCIVSGLTAALYARERTGKGQEVSFSLLNTAVWALNQDISVALYLGKEIPKTTRTRARNPLWNNYLTKDRRWIQLVMVQSDRFWSRFCKVMGLSHLENDPLYKTSIEREQNFESLIKILDDVFSTKTLEEWEELFENNELVCSRVQTVLEIIEDPQAKANDFWVEIDHPVLGKLKTVASPVKFRETPASIKTSAPQLGQHTEEVLLGLGYTWDDITKLKEIGAI